MAFAVGVPLAPRKSSSKLAFFAPPDSLGEPITGIKEL